MIDSNFSTLKYCRLSRKETNKRLAHLENTIKSLETYHHKAKPSKRKVITCLIVRYEELAEVIKSKLGE